MEKFELLYNKYKKQCKITFLSFLLSSVLLFVRYFLTDDSLLNVVLFFLGVTIFILAVISGIYAKKLEKETKKEKEAERKRLKDIIDNTLEDIQ